MKKLLAVLLCCTAFSVQAESLAWLPNNAGGRIVLTDEPCDIKGVQAPNSYKAVSHAPSQALLLGCWGPFKYDSTQVIVYWDALGKTQTYRLQDFTSFKDAR